MSRVVELLCSRRVPQVAVLALMSIGFAGCSADMSTRLSQNPLQSVCPAGRHRLGAAARRSSAASCRNILGRNRNTNRSHLPPPIIGAAVLSDRHAGVSGGGRGLASYAPPGAADRDHRQRRAAFGCSTRASGQSGTTIIVGTSDTLEILARRYNVSSAAILQANGYKGPRVLSPGQQLIIPHQPPSCCGTRTGGAGEQAGCSLPALRPRFMSSIAAILCSASRAAIMFRSLSLPEPTISIRRKTPAWHEARGARENCRAGTQPALAAPPACRGRRP